MNLVEEIKIFHFDLVFTNLEALNVWINGYKIARRNALTKTSNFQINKWLLIEDKYQLINIFCLFYLIFKLRKTSKLIN